MRRSSVTVIGWLALLGLYGCGGDASTAESAGDNATSMTSGQAAGSGDDGSSGAGVPSDGASDASGAGEDSDASSGMASAGGGSGDHGGGAGATGRTDGGSAAQGGDTQDAGLTGSGSGSQGDDAQAEPTAGPFPPVSDFSQPGPYTSTTLANVGPNDNYTVYMPGEPAPEGAPGNPLVAWTSGGGTTHVLYSLLPQLASHGFIVITSNTIPGIGGEAQLGQEIEAGLDWALAENERSGSMLYGRIDPSQLASAGYSMGSLATFQIADDPRLVTTVHISGGNMAPEAIDNLHAPAAFICGIPDPSCSDLLSTACDIAGANCARDFENASTPVFYATFEAGHLGILTSPFMERINAMTTAWLRNHLMGDTTLNAMFLGPDCSYCSDDNWTVERKNLE